MEEYLNKVKSLVDDLKSKDILLPNQVIIAWVLNSLSDEYEGFIQNIIQSLRQDPKAYTIETLFSSLIDEARGRENYSENNNGYNKLLLLKRNRNKNYKKMPYGKYCDHYKLPSHMTDNCWFLFPNKAPKGWKIRSSRPNKFRSTFKNRAMKNINKNYPKSEFSHENRAKQDAIISAILDSGESSQKDKNMLDSQEFSEQNNEKIKDIEQDLNLDSADSKQTNLINNQISDIKLFNIAEDEVCLPLISYDTMAADNNNNKLDNLVCYKETKVNFIIDSAATINTICDITYFNNYKDRKSVV